jgi:hypothetical protein
MFERMHFVANRRNQQISLHFVLLIHHCDSRLLDLCSRHHETKEISKRPFMTIYAQCKTLTASHPTSTLPPRRTIDGTNAVRRRHCSPAELRRRNAMKRSFKPDKPASRQSDIGRGTPPARTPDALPENGCSAGSSTPREIPRTLPVPAKHRTHGDADGYDRDRRGTLAAPTPSRRRLRRRSSPRQRQS